MRAVFLFIIFSFSVTLFAQDIRVEKFVIDGELKTTDPISEGLGRINAVQLNFTKGDKFASELKADFVPMLVLVPPSGDYIIEYPDQQTLVAKYEGEISETGSWFLYIVGDSTDIGFYTLTNRYASASSMEFGNDECSNLKNLIQHSKTDFYFLQDSNSNGSIKSYKGLSGKIISNSETLLSINLYEGNSFEDAIQILNDSSIEIEQCLGTDYQKSESGWMNDENNENLRKRNISFNALSGIANSVILELTHLRGDLDNYTLNLVISNN